MKVNEQIKTVGSITELQVLRFEGSQQEQASPKTLRKRARLVRSAEQRLGTKVCKSK
jgi:hypothetical protein